MKHHLGLAKLILSSLEGCRQQHGFYGRGKNSCRPDASLHTSVYQE